MVAGGEKYENVDNSYIIHTLFIQVHSYIKK